MRVKKHISILSLFFFLLLACDTENNQDTTPPGILTIDSIVPTNGGGIINYFLPSCLPKKLKKSLSGLSNIVVPSSAKVFS